MSERTEGNKFYCVAKDEHQTIVIVSYRHANINSAYAEAVRLTIKENRPFFVMETVLRIEPKVIVNNIENVTPDDLIGNDSDCRPGGQWKADCEKQLREAGFTQDLFTGTWSKRF